MNVGQCVRTVPDLHARPVSCIAQNKVETDIHVEEPFTQCVYNFVFCSVSSYGSPNCVKCI